MAIRTRGQILFLSLGLFFLSAIIVWRFSADPQSFSFFSKNTFMGTSVTIHGTRISVDIADTEIKREQGLSSRDVLPDGSGLLMIFESDVSPGIWMKDMRFPIDIIWIDKDWKIVEVTQSVAPDTYPSVFYPKNSLVRYVLELPAGFSDIHNIQAGDTVER